jgi:cytochrome c553
MKPKFFSDYLGLSIASLAAPCIFVGAASFAADANTVDEPWAERVVRNNLSFEDISGRISGARLDELIEHGERLFTGKFTATDGAGRPMATQAILPTKRRHIVRSSISRLPGPDASACSSCHNEPLTGGAGDITANVFVSEGFTNPDFDTTDPQFSNERNTNHLMGAGLVELLAREMTRDLIEQRQTALTKARQTGTQVTAKLVTKDISFGSLTAHPDGIVDFTELEGVDSDLNIRPFSQKGVFSSLRQFTVNAMNHHHGMQADERFGPRWTGETDFDEDAVEGELSSGDVSALVAWQATLKAPTIYQPENIDWQKAAKRGSQVFSEIGCATCHVPALPLESAVFSDPGPVDVAGTLRAGEVQQGVEYDLSKLDWARSLPRDDKGRIIVPLFSDLKRHRISDQKNTRFGNELLAQRFVDRDQFQTTELWGVASTAPYGHRGDLSTLDEAIRAHGGDATPSTQAYTDLPDDARSALIAYLKTLVIEP